MTQNLHDVKHLRNTGQCLQRSTETTGFILELAKDNREPCIRSSCTRTVPCPSKTVGPPVRTELYLKLLSVLAENLEEDLTSDGELS
jgi:hypothetical protein